LNVSYYPGCSLHGTGKEYGQSVVAVSRALGIGLEEVDDWCCCGASSAHATNFELSVALPARSLAAAEKKGLDVMVPCAACFNRFKAAQHHLAHDAALKAKVEATISGTVEGTVAIRTPIDVILNDVGLDAVRAKVKTPLAGLRPVSYYGCLLVRPPEVCQFDDAEDPVLLDRLMAAVGAEPRPWSFKTDCCGGSLTISRTDQVTRLVDRLMSMAREAGANCIVTACPVCMANLDMRATRGLPVFYFSELMAVAMGLGGPEKWAKLHHTDPRPLFQEHRLYLW
jgi:heterodisulfide reductase subunit B